MSKDYINDMDQSIHYNKNLGFDMDEHGWTEEITEENFYVPSEAEYEDLGEETEEWNWAADRPGLWENIRRKKEREGKNYKPAKTVKEGRPTQEQLKKSQSDADHAESAEYQGRKVKLGKPFKTPGGPKKSAVYVKNGSGKVVIVRFGDPDMKIKKNIPGRRKNFRARHNCSNPGPRWKARYWSCRAW